MDDPSTTPPGCARLKQEGDRRGEQLAEGLAQDNGSKDDIFTYDSTYRSIYLYGVRINLPSVQRCGKTWHMTLHSVGT